MGGEEEVLFDDGQEQVEIPVGKPAGMPESHHSLPDSTTVRHSALQPPLHAETQSLLPRFHCPEQRQDLGC